MRRFLVLLITTTTASSIAAAQPATVEPLAPGPPPEMTFVTLDRFDASHFKLIESGPDGQATGWTAAAVNAGASFDTTAFVWVICAFVS